MKSMPSLHQLFLPAALFFTVNSYNSPVNAADMPDGNWYVKVHGGAGWYSKGKSQTITYGSDRYDSFSDNSDRKLAFQYGLGTGFTFTMQDQGSMEVGIAWYSNAKHEHKGSIDQYGRTNLRNHNYSYKLQSQRVMLEGSWGFPFYQQLDGFITGGLGMGWNKFSDYRSSLLNPRELSPVPDFKDKTKSSFAWQLGAGVSWVFMPQWRASVFYLYANTGKAESNADNQPVAAKYETDNITSHNLMFSLNYLF